MDVNDRFNEWWKNYGSGITPKAEHDMEEHAERIARRAFIEATNQQLFQAFEKEQTLSGVYLNVFNPPQEAE